MIPVVMRGVFEAEMNEALGIAAGDRAPEQLGYRSVFMAARLLRRWQLELRVPQDCAGRFSTVFV